VRGRRWLLRLAVALLVIGLAQYAFTAHAPAPRPAATEGERPPHPVGTPEQMAGQAPPAEQPTTAVKAEEHAGTLLNWLFQVKVFGRPIVTDSAELAFAFSLLLILVLGVVSAIGGRRFSVRPGPFQVFLETALGALRGVVESVAGPRGVGFLPFIGTLFIYIALMNMMGVIPGFVSPTASLSTTLALALVVFLVVQFYGLRVQGLGYIKHFLEGIPLQGAFLLLVPLIFVIHLMGELFRPVSLALRLFGNVTGEETTVLTLIGLVAASRYFYWIPVQLPNAALGLLTSVVQALIFSLLTAVYLSTVIHVEEAGGHEPPHTAAA
jgi:F-type H+-transporting ATPase subunit a